MYDTTERKDRKSIFLFPSVMYNTFRLLRLLLLIDGTNKTYYSNVTQHEYIMWDLCVAMLMLWFRFYLLPKITRRNNVLLQYLSKFYKIVKLSFACKHDNLWVLRNSLNVSYFETFNKFTFHLFPSTFTLIHNL